MALTYEDKGVILEAAQTIKALESQRRQLANIVSELKLKLALADEEIRKYKEEKEKNER